jgi:predicted O-linked N-acetylglucosamine transferase (SPINDLY family)
MKHEDINKIYQEAIESHKSNNLSKAEELYIKIWNQTEKKFANAALHLGIIYLQQNNAKEAVNWLEQALQLDSLNPEIEINLARALIVQQNYVRAESCAARALGLGVDPSRGWYWLGLSRKYQGKIIDAYEALQEAKKTAPNSNVINEAISSLPKIEKITSLSKTKIGNDKKYYENAVRLARQGKWFESVEAYTGAISGNARNSLYWGERAGARFFLNDYKGAISDANQAIKLDPRNPVGWCNLGLALKAIGKGEDAEKAYRKACIIQPRLFEAQLNLTGLLIEKRQFTEAQKHSDIALKIRPNDARSLNNSAALHLSTGKRDLALVMAREAVEKDPQNNEAWRTLSNILLEEGEYDYALERLKEAVEKNPNNALLWCHFGSIQFRLGKFIDANRSYLTALKLDVGNIDTVKVKTFVAQFFLEVGMACQAEKLVEVAIKMQPENSALWHLNGSIAAALGKGDRGLECYQKAIELNPKHWDTYSALIFNSAYQGWMEEEKLLNEAKSFGNLIESSVEIKTEHSRKPRQNRPLKIGYVSGDFRGHSVASFIYQVLQNHNRERVEIYAYYTNDVYDEITRKIEKSVDHWVPISKVSDEEAFSRIESDQIDVLVDLSGHTGYNRLRLFAMKPAPIQAHYLGFMATTGLKTIDYWITDEVLHPSGREVFFTENLWRLPRVWISYFPNINAPQIKPTERIAGRLTFGSFNNIKKLSKETLQLWSEVLKSCPNADLLLKNKDLHDPGQRERLTTEFSSLGISPSRLVLVPGQNSAEEHLNTYNLIDCSLDTFPFTGGTTTCEALWMGVPVITLQGSRMAERMSSSMLSSIGMKEWVVDNKDEYIKMAINVARSSRDGLIDRAGLRTLMSKSALNNSLDLTESLENSYEEMFDKWQKNLVNH